MQFILSSNFHCLSTAFSSLRLLLYSHRRSLTAQCTWTCVGFTIARQWKLLFVSGCGSFETQQGSKKCIDIVGCVLVQSDSTLAWSSCV